MVVISQRRPNAQECLTMKIDIAPLQRPVKQNCNKEIQIRHFSIPVTSEEEAITFISGLKNNTARLIIMFSPTSLMNKPNFSDDGEPGGQQAGRCGCKTRI